MLYSVKLETEELFMVKKGLILQFIYLLTIQFNVPLFPDNECWTLQDVWMVWLHFPFNTI